MVSLKTLPLLLICAWHFELAAELIDIEAPPHLYSTRAPRDRFTRLKSELESGRMILDRSSEKAFLASLLATLDIPPSSQLLVFSTTSLQLSLITPENPRAIYFNEDLYLGYIPGGRIEIVSIDPELGGIFYIFDIPSNKNPVQIERSRRCMNCHSGNETAHVPGLLVKSVLPTPKGGSLEAFRQTDIGHSVPLEERFGGWYITGTGSFTNHWGNVIGRISNGDLEKISVPPGARFDFSNYLVKSSDLLPHLIHEHQAGFINRLVTAAYEARSYYSQAEQLSPTREAELDHRANEIIRYLLFHSEAKIPASGIEGDPDYEKAFQQNRRPTSEGLSLKDFDLETRLFKYRCSYMIYTPLWKSLPTPFKLKLYAKLQEALVGEDPEFSYIPNQEKEAIRSILKQTLEDLPAFWN